MIRRISSSSVGWRFVLLVAVLLAQSSIAWCEDKKGVEAEEPVIDVDPEGQPRGYDGQPPGPTYYIWRDGDTWKVRTRTRKDSHVFTGTITVKGGTVMKISNFEGLERNSKKKRDVDSGRLNDRKNRIDFRFRTAGREDGFDFKLTKKNQSLRFELKLDGYAHRGNISVGRDGKRPPKPIFTVPAQAPQESEETTDTDPKKK